LKAVLRLNSNTLAAVPSGPQLNKKTRTPCGFLALGLTFYGREKVTNFKHSQDHYHTPS